MNNLIQKNKKFIIVVITTGVVLFSILTNSQKSKQTSVLSENIAGGNKKYTTQELKKYDGTNPSLPIYLVLDGNVYDVTPVKEFYKTGGPYHFLAGKDSSVELHQAGGSIIKKKYKIVGTLEK